MILRELLAISRRLYVIETSVWGATMVMVIVVDEDADADAELAGC
jgi:hypothetical protein